MKTTRFALFILVLALVAALPATAATYTIDSVHSSAIFKVRHFNTSNFYGLFKNVSGTITYDAEGTSSIEVTIAADSVDTRSERRDNHLKSPDFLNAAEFPKITFKASGIETTGDSFQVTGQLTLHGVTKDVTASVEKIGAGKHPQSKKDMVGFEARFKIDRTDFDMSFMAGPVGTDIELILSLEASQE